MYLDFRVLMVLPIIVVLRPVQSTNCRISWRCWAWLSPHPCGVGKSVCMMDMYERHLVLEALQVYLFWRLVLFLDMTQ